MFNQTTIDDLMSRCYETLDEARRSIASLPLDDPDRDIYYWWLDRGDMSIYVRASSEEQADILGSFWYGYSLGQVYKIRPDVCTHLGKTFDAMRHELGKSTSSRKHLSPVAEGFLLTHLAAEDAEAEAEAVAC